MSETLQKIIMTVADLDRDGKLTIKDLIMAISMLEGLYSSKKEDLQPLKGISNDK